MKTIICTYNIKWFEYQFNADNTLKTFGSSKKDKELQDQRDGVIKALETIQPEIFGVVEAPNTTTTVGVQSCELKLKAFLNLMGWNQYEVITGYISPGRQELALVYDSTKFSAKHIPGGKAGSKSNPPFDEVFYFDTDDDKIKEVYEFYRPPLEVEFTNLSSNEKISVILMHAKSKGVFTNVDLLHLDRESVKNRKKLFAECSWVRARVEEWLEDDRRIIVMGDINDGPGMDYYESNFGKSAVELLLGDLFDNKRLLIHPGGRPKWGSYGWEPSTTRFKDPITERNVSAQIDHILISKNVPYVENSYKIWNPNKLDEAKPIKNELNDASDHFPVTIEIEW
ncbi:MAG: hypothetical protein N4A46_14285 [Schleiferiaceae bacterium]|jgi:endonuclease/exonuclease/phosphatase family metal-dependent hydrolase|nr:hypothetical protein [Schleiferiaceae bacterium]